MIFFYELGKYDNIIFFAILPILLLSLWKPIQSELPLFLWLLGLPKRSIVLVLRLICKIAFIQATEIWFKQISVNSDKGTKMPAHY